MKWDLLNSKEYYWNIITELDWKNVPINSGGTCDYLKLTKKLINKYPLNIIDDLREFVKEKRKILCDKLNEYSISKIGTVNYYGIGDDSFWDLTAHITGCGHKIYNKILENPEEAKIMAKNYNYIENFQYVFGESAIETILNEE